MPIGVLLSVAVVAEGVIAAPGGGEQAAGRGDSQLFIGVVLLLALIAAGLIIRFGWFRLGAAPARPKLLAPEVALALALAMFILAPIAWLAARVVWGIELPGAVEGGAADPLPLHLQAKQALAACTGQAVIALIYAGRLASSRAASPDRRASGAKAGLVALAAFALVWPVTVCVGWLVSSVAECFGYRPPGAIAHETLRLLMHSPRDGWFVAMVLVVLLAVPILEELFYRGLLQEAMVRIGAGRWPAVVLSSMVFAAMHWANTAPHAVASLFVLSLGFGWAYERTGRLTASIAMHMFFNVANLAVALATQ